MSAWTPTALLSRFTTLQLGGPARTLIEARTEEELIDAIVAAGHAGAPLLLLAGGSNLVIDDAGFDGTVVRIQTSGVSIEAGGERTVVRAAAGERWDQLVARTVAHGLAGIECLAGIPGSVGATPIQNVGAYGQQVSDTIVSVRAYDRHAREVVDLTPAECRFGYRSSNLRGSDRHVVLEVGFALHSAPLGAPVLGMPVAYAELARKLGVEVGGRAPLADVAGAVLELRRGKGMVLDPADPDSVSAGSFFVNPILSGEGFASLVEAAGRAGVDGPPPSWPEPDGRVKTSAAWLIERAGFGRGYGDGRVGISTKHTLALVNRGGASTGELIAMAREIRSGVYERFGVELQPEPILVGVSL